MTRTTLRTRLCVAAVGLAGGLGPVYVRAGGVVTGCDEARLLTALEGGGLVTFACDGVIPLTRTILVQADTTFDATGREVTLDGGERVQVFRVEAGVALQLVNLSVTRGRGVAGAGLQNAGGRVTLRGVRFAGNRAVGTSGGLEGGGLDGRGGAIYSEGDLLVDGGWFEANEAVGGAGGPGLRGGTGGDGLGGAIWNLGTALIQRAVFRDNAAVGGEGGLNDWLDPFGEGGWGGAGGGGGGGGIHNAGMLELRGCTFAGNQARGGPGGAGAAGVSGGAGGSGGSGVGGGLHQVGGTVAATNGTFHANLAAGGNGGAGGDAMFEGGWGGRGGDGRNGLGGAIQVTGGNVRLSSSTLARNQVAAGAGGQGGNANTEPDGRRAGDPGVSGLAWAGGLACLAGSLTLDRAIVAYSIGGGNIGGNFTDGGWNLSSDASVPLTATGSRTNTDPRLGPLADNGGAAPSLALLPGSPAADAIAPGTACEPVDQRGVIRPQGAACDIGSFEGVLAYTEIVATFRPGSVGAGETTELLLTLRNPNLVPLTGIGFTNRLPTGCTVAAAATVSGLGNGVITALPGAREVTLVGATLAPQSGGSLVIPVTPQSAGRHTNQMDRLIADQLGEHPLASQAVIEARTAPVAQTLPPGAPTLESVRLVAEVWPNGERTRYYFEYGPTADYGLATAAGELAPGMEPARVEQSVAGLSLGTSIHYRVVASNVWGVVWGEDRVASTLGPALQALRLDGAGAFVSSPDLSAFYPNATLTIELWFKAEGPGVLVDERGQLPPTGGWQLSLIEVLESGEVFGRFNGLVPLALGQATFGQWHHLALRYDGAKGQMAGMLDGQSSATVDGDRAAPQDSGRGFFLAFGLAGPASISGGGSFRGLLDEVRVWSVARSDFELRENRRARLVGDETGLVMYWRMDQLGPWGPLDATPKANDGWMEGGPEQVASDVPLLTELPPLAALLARAGWGPALSVFQGRVNPRGLATSAWFEVEWGMGHRFTSPAQVVPGEVGEALISAPWEGSVAGAEYRLQLVASNRLGIGISDPSFSRVPTRAAQAVELDGVEDYLATPDLGGWFADATVTIEFWFKAMGPGVLLDERGQRPPGEGWQITLIELLPSGDLTARVNQVPALDLGKVGFGEWHHVALRYNQSARRLDGFLDGVNAGSPSFGDRAAPGRHGYQTYWGFGLADQAHMGSGRPFPGALDEIRIWNVVRTDAEVGRDFTERLSGQEPGLVLYWRCDDADGKVHDASGHGLDARWESSPWFVASHAGLALPIASTGVPVILPPDSVTVHGTVRLSRALGNASFEWGTSTNYGNRTVTQPIPETARDFEVFARLSGLRPAEVYHVRLVVETDEGIGYGADRRFEMGRLEGEGMALELDGAGGALITPDLAESLQSDSLTIELWFQPRGPGVLVTERSHAEQGQGWQVTLLEVWPGGEVVARVHGLAHLQLGRVSFDAWHHVALRYSSEAARLDGVLDGVSSRSATMGDRDSPMESGSAARYAFGLADGTGIGTKAWFPGRLDEIRIWNRALGLSEIRGGLGRPLAGGELGLVGYWRCDEGSGAGVLDSGPRNDDASLIGQVGRVASDIWQDFPLVVTEGARALDRESATLSGWVHTGGRPARGYFEWGDTAAYRNQTEPFEIPIADDGGTVTNTLLGLDAGATYTYRLVAVSGERTRVGADRRFTVPGTGGGTGVAFAGEQTFLLSDDLGDRFHDETLTMELWFLATGPGTLVSEVGDFPPAPGWRHALIELLDNGELWARLPAVAPVRLGFVEFDRWHHVVMRYDQASRRLDGLLDGVPADSVGRGDRQAAWEVGQPTRLGFGLNPESQLPGGTGGMQGLMDEIRIWNRVLTREEIRANAALPLSGSEAGLVGYWRCDEGSGTSVADASEPGKGSTLRLWPGVRWSASGIPMNAWGVAAGEVTDMTASAAILNGLAVPEGEAAAVWFEYGPTPTLGLTTEAQSLPASHDHIEVHAVVGELSPASRYYYRLAGSRTGVAMQSAIRRFDTPGTRPGQALRLDGLDDYLLTRGLRGEMPTDDLTIELWFKPESSGVLVDERDQPPPESRWLLSLLELLPSGEVLARVHEVPAVSLGVVTFDEWHHVVLRYDAVAQQLDGVLDGISSTRVSAGERSSPAENGLDIRYGFGLADGAHLGSGLSFKGLLDEIRVWNIARSTDEILRDMTQPLTGAEPGLVCYFRLDEGLGALTRDVAAPGRPGHLMNRPEWVESTAPVSPLLPIRRRAEGQVLLEYRAGPSRVYALQSSLDLVVWTAIQTNTASVWGLLRFVDSDVAGTPRRFYRAVAP